MAVFKLIFGVKKRTSNKNGENKSIITTKQKDSSLKAVY